MTSSPPSSSPSSTNKNSRFSSPVKRAEDEKHTCRTTFEELLESSHRLSKAISVQILPWNIDPAASKHGQRCPA